MKECKDKFMIQTATVTLEQLVEEGAVDPKRADPSYVRKARSCTLDLSHVFADNVRLSLSLSSGPHTLTPSRDLLTINSLMRCGT